MTRLAGRITRIPVSSSTRKLKAGLALSRERLLISDVNSGGDGLSNLGHGECTAASGINMPDYHISSPIRPQTVRRSDSITETAHDLLVQESYKA